MLGRTQKKTSGGGNGGADKSTIGGLQAGIECEAVDTVSPVKSKLRGRPPRTEADIVDDHDDFSPQYYEAQEKVTQILRRSRKWMSISDIVKQMDKTSFLSDALNALTFAEVIEQGGSVLIPKYRFAKTPPSPKTTKVCSKCRKEKTLGEFERAWTGRPSKCCKPCRERAQKQRAKERRSASST